MDTTTNYGLSKPGLDGPADIEVLGQNADIVDTELKKAQDHRENTNVHMSTAEKGTLNSAVQSATFGGTAVPQDGTKLEIPMPTAAQVGASNPNLLINPCGDINQRGKSIYKSGVTEFTLDRWKLGYNTGGAFIASISNATGWLGDNGKKYFRYKIESVSSGNDASWFSQILEDSDNGKSPLGGKTITFSLLTVPNNSGNSFMAITLAWFDTSNVYHSVAKNIPTSGGVISLTTTLPLSIHRVMCIINNSRNVVSSDVGTEFDFTDAKLEIGSVATPFSPRPYAEELALCQRYFRDLTGSYRMSFYSTDYVEFGIPQLHDMRIAPTLIVSGTQGTDWAVTNTRYDNIGFDWTLDVTGYRNIIATKISHGQTDAQLTIHHGYIFADAEIY